ncbi:aromatic amino acid hydroxylase [Leeuwenhoekiella sp. MAR_2009_132]|uniref:aromatic amino acid hydroxylase n=1 Tax=Leeuwenhoekiella sp. MAR_2009_132 TaxID=1392489 RepID=UPI00048B0F3E|nr:aromatic amino acid hydroxylase [Leeuwenhoekiella sp. MAR_2009_132]
MNSELDKNIETNPLIERLPAHLKQFIKPQHYDSYTPINQAVWRYVMRKNFDYLATVAHKSYVDGLNKTGISIDHIPNMYGMNRILKEIGWAAVAVDGFIPPAAFMEFQAYKVLVIASDIRQLEHIEYTPAPDIIHEGAGHAPIIANPEYAEYLRRFGEIGCKAISSAKDYQLYEAVRKLSILKEAEDSSESEIEETEKEVAHLQNNMGDPSEMALIRNLHWWTVEYGLIGTPENPKIYGAGLLSSIGESAWCMTDAVRKIPYSPDAAFQEFDITKPQPQLYVTPNFAYLSEVLEEFANTMALRTGGPEGINKLIQSKNLGTVELSTGLQISGVFRDIITHKNKVAYIQTEGETALSYHEKELIGHGTLNHPQGYGTALGKLEGINLAIEDMSPKDLQAYNIFEGEKIDLKFEGDILVSGEIITGTRNLKGKIILISFKDCTVSQGKRILFKPEWGIYHLGVGKRIVSAFSGPADFNSFNLINHQVSSSTVKPTHSEKRKELESLYLAVRNYREGKDTQFSPEAVFDILIKYHPTDWLLSVELYEIAVADNMEKLKLEILNHLDQLQSQKPKLKHLIKDGLDLVNNSQVLN